MKEKDFERLIRKRKERKTSRRRERLELEGTQLLIALHQRNFDMWLVSMEFTRHRNPGDYIR